MLHKLSERIVSCAVRNGVLDTEKAEEYVYGIEISLSVGISYLSVLVIGALMHMLGEALLFLFLFVLIRRFAGGFHFKSQLSCYLSTCIISFAVLSLIRLSGESMAANGIMTAASSAVLLVLSPVPAIEKPLDAKEIYVYGRVTRIMICILCGMVLLLYLVHKMYVVKVIAFTMCTTAVLSIFGKIKYRIHKLNMSGM